MVPQLPGGWDGTRWWQNPVKSGGQPDRRAGSRKPGGPRALAGNIAQAPSPQGSTGHVHSGCPVGAHLEMENALNTGDVTSPIKNIMMQPMAPWPFSRQLQGRAGTAERAGCRTLQHAGRR